MALAAPHVAHRWRSHVRMQVKRGEAALAAASAAHSDLSNALDAASCENDKHEAEIAAMHSQLASAAGTNTIPQIYAG